MNNSSIITDSEESEQVPDRIEGLNERQATLVKIVETLRRVANSDDWALLEKLVFNGVLETLERQLKSEAQKAEVNAPELYRLQGQLVWAKKYADLEQLAEFFKQQVESIKQQLKHEQNSADGAA